MGYSIMTPFTSKNIRDRMLAFMQENYKPWSELDNREADYTRGPLPGKELSYTNGKKLVIGFDYNTTGMEREYTWQVCLWMTATIGKGYIWYDGLEKIDSSEWKIDADGLFIIQRDTCHFLSDKEFAREESIVRNEIMRLNDLWRKLHEHTD